MLNQKKYFNFHRYSVHTLTCVRFTFFFTTSLQSNVVDHRYLKL